MFPQARLVQSPTTKSLPPATCPTSPTSQLSKRGGTHQHASSRESFRGPLLLTAHIHTIALWILPPTHLARPPQCPVPPPSASAHFPLVPKPRTWHLSSLLLHHNSGWFYALDILSPSLFSPFSLAPLSRPSLSGGSPNPQSLLAPAHPPWRGQAEGLPSGQRRVSTLQAASLSVHWCQ